MQETPETWVQCLSQEEALEEKIATHFSIPAWEIPWTEEPDSPLDCKVSDKTKHAYINKVKFSQLAPLLNTRSLVL